MTSQLFNVTIAFAVALRLIMNVFSKRRYEYPPWSGVRPWLHSTLAGAVLGASLWLTDRCANFVEAVCRAGYPGNMTDLMAIVLLPAIIIVMAMLKVGNAFAWSVADLKGAWWRMPGCAASIVMSGLFCAVLLSVLGEFIL